MRQIQITLTYVEGWMSDEEAQAIAEAGGRTMRALATGLPTEVKVSAVEEFE